MSDRAPNLWPGLHEHDIRVTASGRNGRRDSRGACATDDNRMRGEYARAAHSIASMLRKFKAQIERANAREPPEKAFGEPGKFET